MKKPILSLDELKELGFACLGKEPLDCGDFYRWWSLKKNDSEIHITYEFNAKYEFTSGYIEFNGEILKGRELTTEDLKLLIDIM